MKLDIPPTFLSTHPWKLCILLSKHHDSSLCKGKLDFPPKVQWMSCVKESNLKCYRYSIIKHTPCWGEEGSIDSSKAGQSHKDRDQPGHYTKVVLPKTLQNITLCNIIYEGSRFVSKPYWQRYDAHHSDSLRFDHNFRWDGGEVGQVGQDIHHCHYRHGYDNSQGQVSTGEEFTIHSKDKPINSMFHKLNVFSVISVSRFPHSRISV